MGAVVGNGRGNIVRWTRGGRRKSRVGGQETTRPHTVSTHICEPQLILHQWKKNKNNSVEHTHSYGYVQTGRREHILYTLSRTLDHWMTRLNTKDRTTENRRRETADSGGETMGSREPSLDHPWLPERCGRNSSTLFSFRQTNLENPTLTTSSPVHLGTLNPVSSANDSNSSCHLVWIWPGLINKVWRTQNFLLLWYMPLFSPSVKFG